MSRKHPKSYSAAIKARIVAMINDGPKESRQITEAIGANGSQLGVYFSQLLLSGAISRFEYRKGMFRYYPGQTAPKGSYRDHRKESKPKPATVADRMAFPVKQTRIWVGDRFNAITIPAAPWETAA